jgi:hypothetical protein
MNSNMQRTGSCPPLDPNRQRVADYKATGREPGHEGNPPQFAPTKDFVDANGKRERVDGTTNLNHNRVRMLKERGIIDDVQLAAAERLENDWQISEIKPVASSILVGNGGSGGSTVLADHKLDGMERFGDAMRAVGKAWPVIWLVVCKNLRVDEAASRLKVHPRRATGQLEIGLDVLALHYGLR